MLDLDQQLREYGTYLDDVGPDVSALTATGRNRPRVLAAAALVMALVGGSVVIAASHDGSGHVTAIGASAPDSTTTTTAPPASAIANAHPTLDQQVAQLNAWYKDWPAEAPGGRPLLEAEWEVCDNRLLPEMAGGALRTGIGPMFASYSPLDQPVDDALLVDGCLERAQIVGEVLPTHQLCATHQRGPNYDLDTVVTKPFAKPVVVFGDTTCASAGYEKFPSNLLNKVNNRRRIEIEIRAVPRACPTQAEAVAWASHVTRVETGIAWPVSASPTIDGSNTATTIPPQASVPANCFRPDRLDWDLRRIELGTFAVVPNAPLQ